MQQPPNQGGGAGELRSDAQQLGSTAANRIHSEVDARKDTAVNQAHSVSSAINQAADGLDDNSPDWIKSAFRQGAQQIQRLADTLEQKDSRQMMREAQDFARNNPGTFLAACAAAGFAAARVLKAGGAQQGSTQSGRALRSGENQSFAGQGSTSHQGTSAQGTSRQDDPAYRAYETGTGIRADTPGEFA